jgi:hypothetical protein
MLKIGWKLMEPDLPEGFLCSLEREIQKLNLATEVASDDSHHVLRGVLSVLPCIEVVIPQGVGRDGKDAKCNYACGEVKIDF